MVSPQTSSIGDLQEEGHSPGWSGGDQNIQTGLAGPNANAAFRSGVPVHFLWPMPVNYNQQDYTGPHPLLSQQSVAPPQPYLYSSPSQPRFHYPQIQLGQPNYSQYPIQYAQQPSPVFIGQGYQPYTHLSPQHVRQPPSFRDSPSLSVRYPPAPGSTASYLGSPLLARLPGSTHATPATSSPSSSPTQERPSVARRRSYHPSEPADRSEWVMWVGNVPNDATSDELRRFFTRAAGRVVSAGAPWDHDASGVLSIFPITRSNCAFVNYVSEAYLHAAIAEFNGVRLRSDNHCAPLVCRVRARDDDLRTGVGAQRGFGMHRKWIMAQEKQKQGGGRKKNATAFSLPPPPVSLPSLTSPLSSSSSGPDSASASTSSSLFEIYFPDRYFILKSLTQEDLDMSLQRGIWATQKHNERVFDRAFRTSKNVYFIFSVNKSREFYGYARMSGPLGTADPNNRVQWARRESSGPGEPAKLLSSDHFVNSPFESAASTPNTEGPYRQSAPPVLDDRRRGQDFSDVAGPALKLSLDSQQQSAKRQTRPALNVRIPLHKEKNDKGEGNRKGKNQKNGGDNEWGENFPLQWLRTERLPFEHTRHIRNPWNHGREVKISRDGTELEPSVGHALLAAWDSFKLTSL